MRVHSHLVADIIVLGNLDKIRFPDWFLFDRAARPEYGPVAAEFDAGQSVTREVANRQNVGTGPARVSCRDG